MSSLMGMSYSIAESTCSYCHIITLVSASFYLAPKSIAGIILTDMLSHSGSHGDIWGH